MECCDMMKVQDDRGAKGTIVVGLIIVSDIAVILVAWGYLLRVWGG